jgi:hypothetical protein
MNYYGRNCEYGTSTETWQIDYCYSMPCKNGGFCYSVWETYTCSCPQGYSGRNCEQKMTNFLSNLIHLILQSFKIKFNMDLNLDWNVLQNLLG